MQQIPSGIDGLDKMLNGGLPSGRCILVCGGPGAGKTILSMQVLMHGAKQIDEPGLFVSLDEDILNLREEMMGFGWNLHELQKKRKLTIIDASPIRHMPSEVKLGNSWIGKRDFSMVALIETIREKAEEIKAKRIVVDPIIALMLQYPSVSGRRTAILELVEFLSNLDATSLITTELRSLAVEREIRAEEFLTHGVIVLHSFVDNKEIIRGIQVEKMRGISHDDQIHPYKITENGIEVFAEEQSLVGFKNVSIAQLGTRSEN
jgi:KaiC/GvpD/RAD55 family RecA-like ATPase